VALIAMIEAGQMGRMLRLSHKLGRLVRVYTKLDTHNQHVALKLDMLINTSWRERVLKELGGIRKLKLWEAAKARIEERRLAPPKDSELKQPSWLYTPERMAESERLKARVRECGRATAHPLIFRDRCKMDFEGEFRLAPLPRGQRAARQVKVYTETRIVDYDWNNIPYAKETGFGAAIVWPAEFYAAMAAEAEDLDERDAELQPSPYLLSSPRRRGPSLIDRCKPLGPLLRGDDKRELGCSSTIPLDQALSRKVYDDLIHSPLS